MPNTAGRRPFGYAPDRVTLDPVEAEAIRRAVRRVLAGEAVSAIAREWNRTGPPTVRGVPWSPSTLRRVLMSGRIAGWRERDGRLVERAAWAAVISLEEHLTLAAVVGARLGRARSYLLSGLVVCGGCGRPMTSRPVVDASGKRRRYACDRRRGGCGEVGIDADRLEQHVLGLMAGRSPAPARSPGPGSVAILEARLDELADMFAAGEIGRAEWARARRSIAERLDAHRSTLAARPDGGAPPPFRVTRAAVCAAAESVTVARRGSANRFDPARVTVSWKP